MQLITEGSTKLSSVPAGGSGGAGGPATTAPTSDPVGESGAPPEPEPEPESDEDMGFGLFD